MFQLSFAGNSIELQWNYIVKGAFELGLPVRPLSTRSLKPAAILLALLAGSSVYLPSRADDDDSFDLSGRIEHSLYLPPVNPDMQVGKPFDETKLKPVTNADSKFWWQVPPWLVGSWHNVGKVRELSFKNLETNEDLATSGQQAIAYKEHEIIGLQMDRTGEIWTCVPTPYLSRDRMGNILNVNMIDQVEPVKVSHEQVVLKLLATTLMVDMTTKKIVSVSQREALQTYRPVEDGKIIILASMRFFDEQGQPKFARDLLTHCRKQLPFIEQEYWTGPGTGLTVIDLRKSFDDYLRAHHLAERIPDRRVIARY